MLGFLNRFSKSRAPEPPKPAPVLAQTVEQRVALSLIKGDMSTEAKGKLMNLVADFPLALLHQLRRDGLTFTTFEAVGMDAKFGGSEVKAASYNPRTKQVAASEASFSRPDFKRYLAHEVGHGVDHMIRLRSVPEDKLVQQNIFDQMNSTHDRQMKKLFKQFTARQLASEASSGETSRSYPGTSFVTRVTEDRHEVTVRQVQTEHDPGSNFPQRNGGWGLGWASKETFLFEGRKVEYREKGAEQSVVISKSAKFPVLSWLISERSGQYLQQSGQPAELFADAAGAYLSSKGHREALQTESPELYSHVASQLSRYY